MLRVPAREVPGPGPGWFRHSAATRWLRDAVSVEVVSKLLGHSSVTTTSAIYDT
jgi:site-specific recombinase XerD